MLTASTLWRLTVGSHSVPECPPSLDAVALQVRWRGGEGGVVGGGGVNVGSGHKPEPTHVRAGR